MTFIAQLPAIVDRVRELAAPLAASLGLIPPAPVDLAGALADEVAENGDAIADAVGALFQNIVAVVAGLFTAVGSRLGWPPAR